MKVPALHNGLPLLHALTEKEEAALRKHLGAGGKTVRFYDDLRRLQTWTCVRRTDIPPQFCELAEPSVAHGPLPAPPTSFAVVVPDLHLEEDEPLVPLPPLTAPAVLRQVEEAPSIPEDLGASGDLLTFDFGAQHVRVVLREGEPWWVATDVCAVLELDRTAPRRLDEDEKGVHSTHTPGGLQEISIINESGLYSLVLGSRKPEAKAFKKWITRVVIPSIRKTGSYHLEPRLPQTYLEALKALTREVEEKQALAGQVQTLGLANRTLVTRVTEMEPKEKFHDEILEAEDGQSVKDVAHEISVGKVGASIGQNRMFRWLRGQGYLIPGTRVPYQRWIDEKLFRTIPQTWREPEETGAAVHVAPKTLITGKGLIRFQKEFRLEDVPTVDADQEQARKHRARKR